MPSLTISEQIHTDKYRQTGETFRGACNRVADALKDNEEHYFAFRDILRDGRFSPPGRVWSAIGSLRTATAYNCFVSRTIPDSIQGIMSAAMEAAETLRLGGGIGYDFSTIRPAGERIVSLDTKASGPVSFMNIFHAVSSTIHGAGDRSAAQMGVLRVDHPDILEFVRAKQNTNELTTMNISVGVTDEFMNAVKLGTDFKLVWGGRTFSTVSARDLWSEIMRSTWDYAEPGVLFIDTINKMNNLQYCETIAATNPCFTGNMRLLTSDGYVTMQELWEFGGEQEWDGDPTIEKHGTLMVVNENGIVPATNVYRTSKSAAVFWVELDNGQSITVTATHRFPVCGGGINTVKTTAELREGDEIPLFLHQVFGSNNAIGYALLAGWLIGDGSLAINKGQQRATLSCYQDDIEMVLPVLQDELTKLYYTHTKSTNQSPKYLPWERCQEHFNHRCEQIRSSVLGRLLLEDGVVGGNKHRVPASIWQGDKETVAAFLRGLFSADGSVQIAPKGTISIRLAQSNKSLLNDCQLLLSQFGIPSRVRLVRKARQVLMNDGKGGMKPYQAQDQHELIIPSRTNCELFAEAIGFIQATKNNKLNGWLAGHPGSNNSENSKIRHHRKVVSVTPAGLAPTFCLTEPLDHQVVAQGFTTFNCGEQPLPPFGACLLGSFNLTAYLYRQNSHWAFDYSQFDEDIPIVVRAMDNVIDRTRYPLPEQELEAKAKRRMGLGVMGLANTIEAMGHPYGSEGFLGVASVIFKSLRDTCYKTSARLAKEKGAFPVFSKVNYLNGLFIQTLPEAIKEEIADCGIRNSHLTSIAPTGTISLVNDNISSGIEPVYALTQKRKIRLAEGLTEIELVDYGKARFGVDGKTADQCSIKEHTDVLLLAQRYMDSAVSKTNNVGPEVGWEEFKEVYMRAWEGGAKGCTTYRAEGKRRGIISDASKPEAASAVCAIDGPCSE